MHLPVTCHPRCHGWSMCHDTDAVRVRIQARRAAAGIAPPKARRKHHYESHHAAMGILLIACSALARMMLL